MPTTIATLCLDAMRTTFECVLASPAGAPDEAALRDAGDAAMREIAEAESRLSLFRRDSLLSHVNRTALVEAVRLDADTLDLLLAAQEVWRLSNGAFDPTVAARMTALGLHEDAAIPALARDAVGQDAAHSRFGAVEIDAGASTIRFHAPVALDLGAIAKGHALDLAGQALRAQGVTCALLHAGTSSVLAIGAPPGEDGWRITIREPGDAPEPPAPPHARPPTRAPALALRDNALGVSAHHGRSIGSAGGPVTHVLDPRTGLPATPRARLAAVIAPTAALADAWSTAALVLGHRPPGLPVDMGCILL